MVNDFEHTTLGVVQCRSENSVQGAPSIGRPVHQRAMPSVVATRSWTSSREASMLMRCRMSGIAVSFSVG
jgi:hypothetical protein